MKNRRRRNANDFDFSGYVTRYGVRCTDSRIIAENSFKHQDGTKVPLLWQHDYSSPDNVIGSILLENRRDGVYGYGKLNHSQNGIQSKELVKSGDIVSMSIFANKLHEEASTVKHGVIREVSLVLSGANPGAYIDNVTLTHGDGMGEENREAAIIYMGGKIKVGGRLRHSDEEAEFDDFDNEEEEFDDDDFDNEEEEFDDDDVVEVETLEELVGMLEDNDTTIDEFVDSMDNDELEEFMREFGIEVEDDEEDEEEEEIAHSDMGGNYMGRTRRVFEQYGAHESMSGAEGELRHAAAQLDIFKQMIEDANGAGGRLSNQLRHAESYGVSNIELLFPDFKDLNNVPGWIKRDTGWVDGFLAGLHKTPFSSVKTMFADITPEEARAKGYVTGDEKDEEVFSLMQRKTSATTIYKKQKLDRDEILEITSFDVVAWLKAEMRLMLEEEIARAILIGDGRKYNDKDKISETNIRPIVSDADFYTHKYNTTKTDYIELIDDITLATAHYKAGGRPNYYTTKAEVNAMLLVKDKNNRRIYKDISELETAMRVDRIIEVEVMEGHQTQSEDETVTYDTLGILTKPSNYSMGTNKGGQVSFFTDFDLDFNQEKYLYETRLSGALVKPKSAVVVRRSTTTVGNNIAKENKEHGNTDKPINGRTALHRNQKAEGVKFGDVKPEEELED